MVRVIGSHRSGAGQWLLTMPALVRRCVVWVAGARRCFSQRSPIHSGYNHHWASPGKDRWSTATG